MEQKIEELKKDISELETLLKQSDRQRVKDILSIELRRLVSEHVKLEDTLKNEKITPSTPIISTDRRYQVKLNNYAWDQSTKFVKFFVTVPGVHNIPAENVVCKFTPKSLELDIKDLDNKDYLFTINKLLNQIEPETSTWKVKTDMVVISAQKMDPSTWSHVTEIEKKVSDAKAKKYDLDKSDNPNDSLMNLMKKMYEEGDDEMKRTIAKAWTEGQNKKNSLDL
ncbi:calcyclin-binding protein-like [Coccinella septempunctata]|uniref:calcyclin-binding protein-like n=1 Tax=Coccinella septempunctata TaxID=41139 RepID=UPI001D0983AA|nr:calcyclin-binding protein-like [Coccinella septempunctata]